MELQQERVIRAKALGFFKAIKPDSFHREGCLGSDLLGSSDAQPSQRLGGACLDFAGKFASGAFIPLAHHCSIHAIRRLRIAVCDHFLSEVPSGDRAINQNHRSTAKRQTSCRARIL